MAKTVLVVDDDPDVIKYVSTILEKIGCQIISAKNGEEAMNKIGHTRPDLVVLDVLMPKRSGIKMYRELKTSDSLKSIPVIILSGISEKTFLRSQEALSEFAGESVPEPSVYIEKPLKPKQFTQIVQDLLK